MKRGFGGETSLGVPRLCQPCVLFAWLTEPCVLLGTGPQLLPDISKLISRNALASG